MGFLINLDLPGVLLIFFSQFFIDIDHEIDYYLMHGKFALQDPRTMFKELQNNMAPEDGRKYYMPLHSWELMVLIGLVFQLPLYFYLSYMVHLLLDVIFNRATILDMSLIVRYKHNFNIGTEKIFIGRL